MNIRRKRLQFKKQEFTRKESNANESRVYSLAVARDGSQITQRDFSARLVKLVEILLKIENIANKILKMKTMDAHLALRLENETKMRSQRDYNPLINGEH